MRVCACVLLSAYLCVCVSTDHIIKHKNHIIFYCNATVTHRAIVHLLPGVFHTGHVLAQALEAVHLIEAAELIPSLLGEPGARVGVGIVQAHATC